MQHPAFAPRPLSGSSLQFALLVPFAVVFVCLFIEAPIVCGGKPVAVPFAPHAPLIPFGDNELTVSVHRDGAIFIDTKGYSPKEFAQKLLEFHDRAPSKRILIRADHTLSFGQLRSVLQAFRAAGFTDVSLITFAGPPAALLARAAA